ncbi:MAG: TonB-dependent receptor [Pseudomonadota bacterium]
MTVKYRKTPIVIALSLASLSQMGHTQMLEEVVVTAQKRAQSLQDVPISVSAVQGEKLQEAGIPNMAAIADYVPNLHIANAAVNTNIYMRGVGSGNNQGFEQSVGMYIDGIYMGRGRQYRNAFVDLERIEVLRGPQGTLFGRNTVAGAINITSASPDPGEVLMGDIAFTAEQNGGQVIEGFLSGSPTENTGLRIGFKHRESEGYIDNLLLDTREPAVEESSYRITFVWQATDDLDLNLKYSKSDEGRTGAASATWLYLSPAERDQLFPNRSAFATGAYAITDQNFPDFANIAGLDYTTYKDNGFGDGPQSSGPTIGRYPDGDDAIVENYALNVNYQMGDYTFTSVTGFSEYEVQSGSDVDWLPLRFIARDDDQDYEQFSQEFRITSPVGERFEYVAGAYYDKSELITDRLVEIDLSLGGLVAGLPGNQLVPFLPPIPLGALGFTNLTPLVTVPLGAPYRPDFIGRNHRYALDSDSWALFFQGTYNISDTLRVTLGLRYTEENKDVESVQFLTDSFTGNRTPSNEFFLGQVQALAFNTYAYNYNDSRTTSELIPSINFQWDINDDSMLYFSFSQGFKSGGFTAADDGEPGGVALGEWSCTMEADGSVNINACYDPTVPNDDFEFEDESVDAFEIGGKHTLLSGAMTVNWAAFYTEYDNLQTAIFKGIGFTVTNAGSSEILGLEVDTRWQVSEGLQIGANIAYLDATYDEFADAPCTAIQLDANPLCGVAGNPGGDFNDLSGEPTLYASDISASILWDYVKSFEALEFYVGGEVNYRDEFNSAGDNDPIDVIPSYTKVNMRIGIRNEQWDLMAFGRNIFDEVAYAQSFDVPVLAGSHARFQEEGSVFGLRAKYSF